MYFNIGLAFCIRLIPLVGNVIDVLFRANTRNAVLEKYLFKKIVDKELQEQIGPQ
jgi:hypothetical protein